MCVYARERERDSERVCETESVCERKPGVGVSDLGARGPIWKPSRSSPPIWPSVCPREAQRACNLISLSLSPCRAGLVTFFKDTLDQRDQPPEKGWPRGALISYEPMPSRSSSPNPPLIIVPDLALAGNHGLWYGKDPPAPPALFRGFAVRVVRVWGLGLRV